MIRKLIVMVVAATLMLTVKGENEKVNLVKNGNFDMMNSEGVPVKWNVSTSAKQVIQQDKTNLPKGVTNSIKITIKGTNNKVLGYLSQHIKGVEPNTEFILTGKLKSTTDKLALLQIKLLKNKKELKKRIDTERSTKNWKTLSTTFTTGDADTIVVLCRFLQKPNAVNEAVWLADIKLVRK